MMAAATRVRVAVCADFREEGWPSMDRVADHLLATLVRDHATTVRATSVCPPFKRRASRLWSGRLSANLDRGLNRLVDYPRHVGAIGSAYDVFHVVDHSYSQLVHRLPPDRTVVTCHDLDTFRSVLVPTENPRSPLFQAMTRHILSGLRRAAVVTCDTAVVRDELVSRSLVPAERVIVAPIGVGAEFVPTADAEADREAAQLITAPPGAVEILHVGSPSPRKRLEAVLKCCADVARTLPGTPVRLVRVGGPLTAEQESLARRLGIRECVIGLPVVDDRTLAAIYRRAAVVILPSAREGFGLPIVEALACGTPVIASDLPVLREVGGPSVDYCDVDDGPSWVRAVLALVGERSERPDRMEARSARGIAWASRFTWTRFGDTLTATYLELAGVRAADTSAAAEACRA